MDLKVLKNNLSSTPTYVFDENKIFENLTELVKLKEQSGCQVLYSIKALPLKLVLNLATEYLDGLSVSSLFEARLAYEILADKGTIHLTTPGIRASEFKEITELCSHISFNSISQYQCLQSYVTNQCSLGLRLNPKLSFSEDIRFDPCRPFSKLGVDVELIAGLPEKIEGLHFHTVFANNNYDSLERTIGLLTKKFEHQLADLKWINFGGGYLYNQIKDHQPFIKLVKRLKSEYPIEIYIEPGNAVVGNAGYLVTTVIDRFISDGKEIAVLDTTVNHNPEVFEYQKKPKLLEADITGNFSFLLVGSSCLAGDVFGEYQFGNKLIVGDRLVFLNVGAYSLIKANRFNGYNLPDVYALDRQKKLILIKRNTYGDFREQWME